MLVEPSLTGRVTTDWFANIIMEHGTTFSSLDEKEIVRDIKEKLC
jgi:hypothetical protein